MSMIANLFAVPPSLLEELKTSAATREEWLGDPSELNAHSLDKAWHGLHYLLTGVAGDAPGALGQVVMGGKPLSSDDMGYGPARYLTADEVKAIAKALKAVTADDLRARFDGKRMDQDGVYPHIWERDGASAQADILEHFERVKSYYARAAKAGLCMLSWLA